MADVFRGPLYVNTLYRQDPNAWWRSWTWPYQIALNSVVPVGKQFYELPPRAADPYPRDLRTWSWRYNLNLVGKDFFPPGVQPGNPVHLLTPIAPPLGLIRSWTQSLVTLTLAPPSLPPGEAALDLAPRNPDQSLRSWTWSYNLNLRGKDFFPPGVQPGNPVHQLPPRPYSQLADYSWIEFYNLTLIGQDKFPPGEQTTALPLPPPSAALTWTQNPVTLQVVALPPGEAVYDLAPRPPPRFAYYNWTVSYNLNLIGADQLPAGAQRYERGPFPPFYRDWAQSLTTTTLFTVAMPPGMVVDERPPVSPFYRDWALNFALTGPTPFTTYNFDWPLPGRSPLPVPSWAAWYNLNLRGQDFLPVGDRLYDRPVLLPVEPATRTWTLWLNLTTLNTPVGEQYFERPAPVTWLRDWALNLQLTTLAPVTTPFAQTYWPTPSGPQTPQRSWTFSYNLNLVGQDQLPKGEQVTDLPPPAPLRAENLKTWIEQTNLALLVPAVINIALPSDWQNPAPPVPIDPFWGVNPATLRAAPVVLPANQYDWPLPRAPQLPARGMTAGFPPELIGQDQLPRGAQVYDLAPRGTLPTDYRSWIYYTSLALNNSLGIPVGEQVFELAPRAALPASDLRTWVDRTKLALLVPFNQLDWPVPIGPLLPQRGVATFPSLALTTSVAPFAQTYWPLPIAPQLPQRTFTASFPLSLIGQDQFPPGRQVSELSPFGYPYPFSLRTGTASPAVPPIVVVTAGGETLLLMGMG